MGFSRQEYWSGLPFPSPGDLPDPGIEPGSPTLRADALTSEPPGKPQSRIQTNGSQVNLPLPPGGNWQCLETFYCHDWDKRTVMATRR